MQTFTFKCIKCGAAISSETKFCTQCGASQSKFTAPSTTIKSTNLNFDIPKSAKLYDSYAASQPVSLKKYKYIGLIVGTIVGLVIAMNDQNLVSTLLPIPLGMICYGVGALFEPDESNPRGGN